MLPPLGIIQARLHSSRLPRKMLQLLGGKPLLAWAWEAGVRRFGAMDVVIACPTADLPSLAGAVIGARFYGYPGNVWDVLARLHACAHVFRTDPLSVLHRVTPDDWPVETDREVFTLKELDALQREIPQDDRELREHIGLILPGGPYRAGPGVIEINSAADYVAAKRKVAREER